MLKTKLKKAGKRQNEVYTVCGIKNIKTLAGRYEKLVLDIGAIGSTEIYRETLKKKREDQLFPALELAQHKKWFVVALDTPESAITDFYSDFIVKLKIKNCGIVLAQKGESLPFADKLFDRIELHYVLTNCSPEEGRKALAEADRTLKQGGLIVISGEMNTGSELSKKGRKILDDFLKSDSYVQETLPNNRLIPTEYAKFISRTFEEQEHIVYIMRKIK